jgi:glycosyltransferase involved in cell wall biosynthesis
MHGIFETDLDPPDFSDRAMRILIFGKYGSYKKLDFMIESFRELLKQEPQAELVVAGGDHPAYQGYVASMAEKYRDVKNLSFTGYVPEEDIPSLFKRSALLALPYTSNTGTSGVAHLGCNYGLPIITTDLPDFQSLVDEEGMVIKMFPANDQAAFVQTLLTVLHDKKMQRDLGLANYNAASRMTMDKVVGSYVRYFEIEHLTKYFAMANFIRLLPIWFPGRSRFYAFVDKRSRRVIRL